jgi:hypothetical protein
LSLFRTKSQPYGRSWKRRRPSRHASQGRTESCCKVCRQWSIDTEGVEQMIASHPPPKPPTTTGSLQLPTQTDCDNRRAPATILSAELPLLFIPAAGSDRSQPLRVKELPLPYPFHPLGRGGRRTLSPMVSKRRIGRGFPVSTASSGSYSTVVCA